VVEHEGQTGAGEADEREGTGGALWRRRIVALLVVTVAVAFSAFARIETAFSDPNFDTEHAEGMLKSDPALLVYITERIVEGGGLPPDDFRADPRVQYPELTDLAAEFTVGQEFLVAWTWRAFGGGMPLHAFCIVLMGIVASLAAAGVYLLARELTGSPGWGVVATVLFCLLPANYRTIGFILVREDLSFPLFAIHLALLARAVRVATGRSFLLAGLALAGALATWHAMSFFAALELAAFALWYLRLGGGLFRARGAGALFIGPILAGVMVPALREAGFLLSPPLLGALALFAADLLRMRFRLGRLATLLAAAAVAIVLLGAAAGIGGSGGYDHVWEVLAAKIRTLGALPADPAAISFDARLLWQGPFATLEFRWIWPLFGWGTLLFLATLPRAVAGGWRGERSAEGVVLALLWISALAAWLFSRTAILPGLLIPVAGVVVLARLPHRRVALALAGVLLSLQALAFAGYLRDYRISWYLPPVRQDEIAALVEWVAEHLEPDEAIAGDFMNSTAILVHCGNGIVLQPKYETDRSRRRAQAFLETFFFGSAEQMRSLVRERFRCRYVLFDRYTLGRLSPWVGGLPLGDPTPLPGTAAALFLSEDAEVLERVPGFELLYRSPLTMRGVPFDAFRLYRLPD
jgi:hypothetical protein